MAPPSEEPREEAERRRRLHHLLGLERSAPEPDRDPDEEEGGWRGLRNTLLAVAIGTALFVGSWFVLDLQPLSRQERAELFQFTVAVPALLDLCADRAAADQAEFHRSSLRVSALFREARDRSAAGLVEVAPGSTMGAQLDQLTATAVQQARDEVGSVRSASEWRTVCGGLLSDFRSDDGAWARLQEKYPRQLRKLDLSRPRTDGTPPAGRRAGATPADPARSAASPSGSGGGSGSRSAG